MNRRRALSWITLLLVCGGCIFAPRDEAIPEPSTCTNAPSEASITEAAVGTAPGPWRRLGDGDGTYVVEDDGGDEHLALRAAWRGDDAPACARVRVAIRDPEDGSELAHHSGALTSSPQNGWRVSDAFFFETRGLPDEITAVVEVYDAVSRTTLTVGGYDASEDAGP